MFGLASLQIRCLMEEEALQDTAICFKYCLLSYLQHPYFDVDEFGNLVLIGLMQIIDADDHEANQRLPPQHDEPGVAQICVRQLQRERGEACGA